jgi:hypothetical protein
MRADRTVPLPELEIAMHRPLVGRFLGKPSHWQLGHSNFGNLLLYQSSH